MARQPKARKRKPTKMVQFRAPLPLYRHLIEQANTKHEGRVSDYLRDLLARDIARVEAELSGSTPDVRAIVQSMAAAA